MKNAWPLTQILLLSSIAIAIVAVVVTIIMTNTTLRSVEKNLPNTLIKELVSLDLVLGHLSEVVTAAQITAENASSQNFDKLTDKVQTAVESVATLRLTYVFDNLIQASAFHAVVAPAIADLQIWLSEGISGYGPRSKTTAQIVLSRILDSFQKAKILNQQSRLNAQNKLNEGREKLDRFLSSVNLLFLLTLLITLIMIFLFVRQHLLKLGEIKAQKTLQTQRDLLNSLFENILLGITVWSKEGLFLFANKSFTHLTGYRVEDIKDIQNWFTKVYPDPVYRDMVLEDWNKSTQLTDVVREFKITCKNGQVKDVEFRGTFLPDGRALVSLTDITERKALEAQYEQAQKMEALGTLAGGIAHDFNNLLSGIFGYIDLARKKTKESKTEEYLTKAFNTSGRAKGLTHQLLTFSKGGAPIKRIDSLVPFLQETTQFALSGADVSCSFNLPDDLWMCDYDKNQLGQVIDNIVINAHHAMPSGGNIQVDATNVIVKGREHPALDPGKYVKISISDTGMGIAEKYIPRIFDPFFTTKQKGSGLGLATSYSIVKRHGGIIDIESILGVGATFHIFIPAAEHPKIQGKTLVEKHYQGSGRILIMDDEEMIQEMMTDMLETMGFTIKGENEGRGAVEAFKKAKERNDPFRAVILDLTVKGGMGGKETVKEIRKTDKTVPVFVASGYSEDEAIANPEAFGFTASLEKPFSVAQLARMFEKHLKS
ncbi:MAG: hypothetical protein DRH93_05435 [Deltaproteobacteria bacterium]|nr:MAG: hypothetical protein DRH93_05435 [Deltaproteobacteria bacterium]